MHFRVSQNTSQEPAIESTAAKRNYLGLEIVEAPKRKNIRNVTRTSSFINSAESISKVQNILKTKDEKAAAIKERKIQSLNKQKILAEEKAKKANEKLEKLATNIEPVNKKRKSKK
jgi:hypothetical protein